MIIMETLDLFQTNMHASFPYDGSRGSAGGGGGGGGRGGVEYGAVRRPDALLPPPGLDQTDLVLHTSLVDDPQVSDDVRNRKTFFLIFLSNKCWPIPGYSRHCLIFSCRIRTSMTGASWMTCHSWKVSKIHCFLFKSFFPSFISISHGFFFLFRFCVWLGSKIQGRCETTSNFHSAIYFIGQEILVCVHVRAFEQQQNPSPQRILHLYRYV